MNGTVKLNNNKKLNYTYETLGNVDFQILVQRLMDLSEVTYNAGDVDTSEDINGIIDMLVDFE